MIVHFVPDSARDRATGARAGGGDTSGPMRPAGALVVRLRAVFALAAAAILTAPALATAQSNEGGEPLDVVSVPANVIAAARRTVADHLLGEIPTFASLNPSVRSRSGLQAQPYRLPRPGWSYAVRVSWANVIENEITERSRYLFDAEVMRGEVEIARDLGRDLWVSGTLGVTGAFDGVADGFLDWYHDKIGFHMREREERPSNVYADTLILRDALVRARSNGGIAPSDVRLTAGLRWGAGAQTALSVTVPTAADANVDWRGVPTVSVVQTARARLLERVLLEISGGASYAARSGPDGMVQRRWGGGGSTAARIRLMGGHSVYGLLFFHSSPYVSTGLRTKDSGELSTDFGYAYRWPDGREIRIGLSEDLVRQDQGIDVGLRVSFVR